jgi:hypothetical protein
MRRPKQPLPRLTRRCFQVFAAATALTAALLVVAVALTSMEEVSRFTRQLEAVMRWVRPVGIAAVLFAWPWLIGAAWRRRWLDDQESYVLLAHHEHFAVLLVTLELVLGQQWLVLGALFFVAWHLFRAIRPGPPIPPFRG